MPQHYLYGLLSTLNTGLEDRLNSYCFDNGVALFKLPNNLYALICMLTL